MENTAPQGNLMILIVGPSGSGKGTLMHEITRQDPRIKFFITATTRPPRDGEYDGVHYWFLSKDRFAARQANHEFLETDDHYNHSYGTLRSVVEGHMAEGDDVISDLNWAGVAQVQTKMPDKVLKILILPPSLEELKDRFKTRAQTSNETDAKQLERQALIAEDLQHLNDPTYIFKNEDMAGSTKKDYDAIVINDDLATAVADIQRIINERRTKDAAAA